MSKDNDNENDSVKLSDIFLEIKTLNDFCRVLKNESEDMYKKDKTRKAKKKKVRRDAVQKVRNKLVKNHVDSFDKIKKEHDNKNNIFYLFEKEDNSFRIPEENITIHESKITGMGFVSSRKEPSPQKDLTTVLKNIKEQLGLNANNFLRKTEVRYENKLYVQLYEDIRWDLNEEENRY